MRVSIHSLGGLVSISGPVLGILLSGAAAATNYTTVPIRTQDGVEGDVSISGVDLLGIGSVADGRVVDLCCDPIRLSVFSLINAGIFGAGTQGAPAVSLRTYSALLGGASILGSDRGNATALDIADAPFLILGDGGGDVQLFGGAATTTFSSGAAIRSDAVDDVAIVSGSTVTFATLTGLDNWMPVDTSFASFSNTQTGIVHDGASLIIDAGTAIAPAPGTVAPAGISTGATALELTDSGAWTVEPGGLLNVSAARFGGPEVLPVLGGTGLDLDNTALTAGNAVITGGSLSTGGAAVHVRNGGSLTLNAPAAGTLPATEIRGGDSSGSDNRAGAGIVVDHGQVSISDGVISGGNRPTTPSPFGPALPPPTGADAHYSPGAPALQLRDDTSLVHIDGGSFSGGNVGGAAIEMRAGSLEIDGGTFEGSSGGRERPIVHAAETISIDGSALLIDPFASGGVPIATVRDGVFTTPDTAVSSPAALVRGGNLILEGGELSAGNDGFDAFLEQSGRLDLSGGTLDKIFIVAGSVLSIDAWGDGPTTDPFIFDPATLTLTGRLDDGTDLTISLFTSYENEAAYLQGGGALGALNTLNIGTGFGDELRGDIVLLEDYTPPGDGDGGDNGGQAIPAPAAVFLFGPALWALRRR